MEIPIIDIFAGPGGLGEGFSSLLTPSGKKRRFKIVLSIEKDPSAHKTLTLRSFFRQFKPGNVPKEYYSFIRGAITLEQLFERWPVQAEKAKREAWHAELGEGEKYISDEIVDRRIKKALKGEKQWLLIGGPPCQPYSLAGRSRRKEKILDEDKDEKVGLYKQYLRILAIHNPAVFIMENVAGILSAKTKESPVFSKILIDLANPVRAFLSEFKNNGVKLKCPGYRIYSLVAKPEGFSEGNKPILRQKDFIIRSENYGIPQTRHRVILLGIRNNIDYQPGVLKIQAEVPISSILSGLLTLRSKLSRSRDNGKEWKTTIKKILSKGLLSGIEKEVIDEIREQSNRITIPHEGPGGEFIPNKKTGIGYRPDWYLDGNIQGICNHITKGHMESDLFRYFFASCFALVKKRSPRLVDFPPALLPAHKNVQAGIVDENHTDRFRVQLWNRPSKTITSHIARDGHYYIHPDPKQCRSFTVREAARIQTFPDNYYFYGPRTEQYRQVGNAVPPLLAMQIAEVVNEVFKNS